MVGTVTLGYSISSKAMALVKAGKAVLSSGGVRSLNGELLELAKPVSAVAQKTALGKVGALVNISSSLSTNAQCAFLQHSVNVANLKLNTVIEQLKPITKAVHGLQHIQLLSWINAAFSLANCGISIAGFYMTLKELEGVHGELHQFYDRYKQDRQSDKIETFRTILLNLKADLAYMQKLHNPGNFDRYEFRNRIPFIVEHLNQASSFQKTMMTDFSLNRIDGKIGCTIIFDLMAAYSQLMNEFCCWYFYASNDHHALFQDWYSVLEEANSPMFKSSLNNYITFSPAYALISPEEKISAGSLLMEGISQQIAKLNACRTMVETLSIEEFTAADQILSTRVSDALMFLLPEQDRADFNRKMTQAIQTTEVREDLNQFFIPVLAV